MLVLDRQLGVRRHADAVCQQDGARHAEAWRTFKKVEAIPPPPKDLPVKKAAAKEDVVKLVKNVVEDVKK